MGGSTTVTLSEFRWRRTQRRLVANGSRLARFDIINVVGKTQTVPFRFWGRGVDPHTKTHKNSRIYKPDESLGTPIPEAFQDLILYVHV